MMLVLSFHAPPFIIQSETSAFEAVPPHRGFAFSSSFKPLETGTVTPRVDSKSSQVVSAG